MNHEYVDEGLLFPDGQANWSARLTAGTTRSWQATFRPHWKHRRAGCVLKSIESKVAHSTSLKGHPDVAGSSCEGGSVAPKEIAVDHEFAITPCRRRGVVQHEPGRRATSQ